MIREPSWNGNGNQAHERDTGVIHQHELKGRRVVQRGLTVP